MGEWIGTATFTIEEGSETSTEAAELDLPPEMVEWVQADAGGSLILKPPKERGFTNSINLLPVEFEGKPLNGFDDTVDPKWQSAPENGETRTVYFKTSQPDLFEFKTADQSVATVTAKVEENGRIPLGTLRRGHVKILDTFFSQESSEGSAGDQATK